jgi:hypothetical protein
MTTNTTTTTTTVGVGVVVADIVAKAQKLIETGWGQWTVDEHLDTVGYWEAAASAEAEWVAELLDAIRHLTAGDYAAAMEALDAAYHTEAAYGGDDTMRVIRPTEDLIAG